MDIVRMSSYFALQQHPFCILQKFCSMEHLKLSIFLHLNFEDWFVVHVLFIMGSGVKYAVQRVSQCLVQDVVPMDYFFSRFV
jgi:hypothetical protein